MGLCFSKSEQSEKNTSGVNRTKNSRRTLYSQSAKGQRQQESVGTQQPKTEKTNKPKTARTTVQASRGETVGSTVDENREKLSPKEAARLAAERRLKESDEKSKMGELGKKLALDRGKTTKTHVLRESERRQAEKNSMSLVFD